MATSCHGSPPENAPRRYLAKTGSPGTHRGDILPLSDAGGDAFREHFATGERPGTHRGIVLPLPNAPRPTAISCHDRPLSRMPLEGILPRRPSAARACSSGHREHAGKNGLQHGRRRSKQPAVRRRSRVRRPRDLACGSKQILLRNRSGATKSGDANRTKRRAIQQRMPTRPRNREKILVPFA